jgi:hypothetical protein
MILLIEIINRCRMLKSWDVLPAGKADAYARTWAEVLEFARVPVQHYKTLYKMAFEGQAWARSQGEKVPELNAELIAAQWPALRRKIEAEQNKYALTENATSQCPRCFGSGWAVTDGYAARCDHRTEAV